MPATMTTTSEPARITRKTSRAAISWLHTSVLGLGLVTACADVSGDDEDYGTIYSEVAVSQYQTSTCSTSVVIGLSKQIADEVGCINPTGLTPFKPSANLRITSNAVLPYLSAAAKTDLEKVAATRVVQVNSAFRTVAQQYLLYRWFQLGRCGITAAATPGRSNHESGRALDLQNYSSLISAMAARSWSHSVPGDPVHFDHTGSPDIRGRDVLAFQRLWNRNNPNDKIGEDGAYGPQTESRLRQAPATGFPVGATCGERVIGADVLMIEGPDKLAPGARAMYSITVKNTGNFDWPATTKIVVAGGATSEMFDDQSWVSPSEIGTIGVAIPSNEQGVLQIQIATPVVTEETALFTQLTLNDGETEMGQINLAVTVTPNGDEDTSGDSDDQNDDGAAISGGCNAGGSLGSLGWLALALPALIARRRRR